MGLSSIHGLNGFHDPSNCTIDQRISSSFSSVDYRNNIVVATVISSIEELLGDRGYSKLLSKIASC